MPLEYYIIAKETRLVDCDRCAGTGVIKGYVFEWYCIETCSKCKGTKKVLKEFTHQVEITDALVKIGFKKS